jgi:hypothetical protein
MRFRRHMTFANVCSFAALFVALSTGGAYAAGKLIDGKTIKPGTVGKTQLAKNAVTSSAVKNGSLTKKDFKAGTVLAGTQGPAGAQGPKGDAGAAGANGLTKTYTSFEHVNYTADGTAHVVNTLALPAGRYLVNAAIDVSNNDLTDPTDIACSVTSVGGGGADVPARGSSAPTYSQQTIAISGVATLASAGNLDLACTLESASGITFGGARMNATQVSEIVSQ